MMKIRLFFLFVVILGISSCRKSKDPVPEKGSITGTFSLNGAAEGVVASSNVNGQTISYNPTYDTKGNFKFADLAAGEYTLSFTSNARYMAPAPKSIKLTAGQNIDLGIITFAENTNNGSIIGKISPAGAAVSVWAITNNPMYLITATPDPVTGNFTLTNLPPSSAYSITFIEADKFTPPVTQKVSVSSGQQVDVGTYNFTSYGHTSVFSCKLNGSPLSLAGTSSYLSNVLSLSGEYLDGPPQKAGTKTHRLAFKLDNVTSPGTYVCNGTTTSVFTYTLSAYQVIGLGTSGSWTSQKAGGSATVIVTAIDQVNNTITGTFSATLVTNALATNPDQLITEGAFSTRYK